MCNIIKKILMCIFLAAFSMLSASAAAAGTLEGIDIKRNEKGKLNIILNTKGRTGASIKSVSPDIINIMLKSAAPSESAYISYGSGSFVNNVVIQKKNNSGSVLIIEGADISDADIFLKNVKSGMLQPVQSSSFFGFNSTASIFSAAAAAFILYTMRNRRRRNKTAVLKQNSRYLKRAYYTSDKAASVPQEFIINRYMEQEELRKAG